MKAKIEDKISRLTTALVGSIFVVCIAGFVVDVFWGFARFELVFRALAGLAVVSLVACVIAGWVLGVRYLLFRSRSPATPAEYLLIGSVIFMPLATIYVLRSIRQREADEHLDHQ